MQRRQQLRILGLVLSAAVGATVAYGYTAQEILDVHQGSWDTANDLHVKFWQKEDDIHVTGWTVGPCSSDNPGAIFGQPTSQQLGDQPEPHHSNGDDGTHAVDLDWDGISVPNCTTVSIPFAWTLTDKNTKRVEIFWTKDGVPKKHGAKNGWRVGNPVPIGGDQWTHYFEISNDDDPNDPNSQSLIIQTLRYGVVDGIAPLTFEQLGNFSDWIDAPQTTMTLAPGEAYSFNITTSFGDTGHILGLYEIVDQLRARQIETREVFDHPTPEPSALLLLSVGVLLALRRG